MDYQQNAASQNVRVDPELGKLKAAAERVGFAAVHISGFLERFNGPCAEQQNTAPQPPPHYRNDIATLFDQITLLEEMVASLDTIG